MVKSRSRTGSRPGPGMVALASAIVLFAVGAHAQSDRDGHRARLAGVQAEPASPSSSRSSPPRDAATRSDPAPAQAALPSRRPDPDRFALDPRRVTESVQADGTVIIALNGEGMEKMSLADEDGRAVVRCGAALEARLRDGVPADFRVMARRRDHATVR